MKYIITYTQNDEWCGECTCEFTFEGNFDELQDELKGLRELDCYNFSVTEIDECGERW